jgi:hypothetical protein
MLIVLEFSDKCRFHPAQDDLQRNLTALPKWHSPSMDSSAEGYLSGRIRFRVNPIFQINAID